MKIICTPPLLNLNDGIPVLDNEATLKTGIYQKDTFK
jgi:hypothetical protein